MSNIFTNPATNLFPATGSRAGKPTLVFIDSQVQDYQSLLAGVSPTVEVFILDENTDGVAEITATLGNYSQVEALHLVSHGSAGSLRLGRGTLELENIDEYATYIYKWRSSLAPDAEILIYGCNVAEGHKGKEFLEKLHLLSAVNIAATATLTGNAALGGNWNLEVTRGEVSSPLAFSQSALSAYAGVLADITVTITNDVINGDTSTIAALQGNDGGDGISLREAVIAANNTPGDDTIILASGSTYTLSLGSLGENDSAEGDLDILSDKITIKTDDDSTNATVDGNGTDRVFDVRNTSSLSLNNIIVTGGNASGSSNADKRGGGIRFGGDNLELTNSTISGNTALINGAGIIINTTGTATIANSTISGNSAATWGGGILNNNGIVTVTNSTISGNVANRGGGINNQNGTITIASSTISDNTGNNAGGGIFNSDGVSLANSIVAKNRNDRDVNNDGGAGTFTSNDHNLIGNDSIGFASGMNDVVNVDPLLGGLDNNGGPTQTHALQAGSPALNVGSTGEATDQRGVARPQESNPDIGAYERDTTAPTVGALTPADNATGVTVSDNLVVKFNETVTKGTGNIVIKRLSDDDIFQTFNEISPLVTVSGDTVTIDPTNPLLAGTEYYVEIANGAIEDIAGNDFAGISGNITWNFSTAAPADTTAPTASNLMASDITSGGGTNQSFTIDYADNIAVDVSTLDGSDIIVVGPGGNIAASFTIVDTNTDGTPRTATYQIAAPGGVWDNADNGTYTVQLQASQVADTSGNTAAASSLGSFNVNIAAADTTAPTVSSIARKTPSNSTTNASSVTFAVTFSENVNNLDPTDFILDNTGVSASIASVSATSGTTVDVVVNGISGDGTLSIDVPNSATIIDDASNALTAAFTAGEEYTIDNTAPTVSSITRKTPSDSTTNASSVTFAVTFSEKVNNLDTGDFNLDTTGGVSANIASVFATSSTTVKDVVVDSISGEGTLSIDVLASATIQDDASNSLTAAFTAGEEYTIAAADTTAPTVSSITRKTPSNSTTNASSVTFEVTFSENVNNLDTTDFTLETTGGVSANIASVSAASGTTVDVVVDSISGEGTLSIDVPNSATIEDDAGNDLTAAFTAGEQYTIEIQELTGAPGIDNITGDDNNNRITGGTGRDVLTGGGGSDQFAYTKLRDAGDTITDFMVGEDKILLTQLFTSLVQSVGNLADAKSGGFISFVDRSPHSVIMLDPDGSGANRGRFRPLAVILNQSSGAMDAESNFIF